MLLVSPLGVALGAASWSLMEYSIHRWVGHGPSAGSKRRRHALDAITGDSGAEHLKHHADPTYFTPTSRKVTAASVVVGGIGLCASALAGPRFGLGFALGLGATYAAYELTHRRTHTHPPTGPYSRWTRKHHLHHHYGSPKTNHGVTSPVWDVVFGTYAEPGRVRIPEHRAPVWMLDDEGQLWPELTKDYEIRRRPSRQPAAQC